MPPYSHPMPFDSRCSPMPCTSSKSLHHREHACMQPQPRLLTREGCIALAPVPTTHLSISTPNSPGYRLIWRLAWVPVELDQYLYAMTVVTLGKKTNLHLWARPPSYPGFCRCRKVLVRIADSRQGIRILVSPNQEANVGATHGVTRRCA